MPPDCAGGLWYIYNLPKGFASRIAEPFGRRVATLDDGNVVWDTQQFNLGAIFHSRLRLSGCATADPERADMFFVPAYTHRSVNRPSERSATGNWSVGGLSTIVDHLERVRVRRCPPEVADALGSCSALTARGGADHVLIQSRNGSPVWESHPFYELNYFDPRYGNAARVSIEEPETAERSWGWQRDFGDYAAHSMYTRSLPFPSLVHADPNATQTPPPWHGARRRSGPLVAAAFSDAHGARNVKAIRHRLLTLCSASPESCANFALNHSTSGRHAPRVSVFEGVARLYAGATFCLQPPGDAVSRKGVIDSLLLGCIPVLFHEGMGAQWSWHWGAWQPNSSLTFGWRDVLSGRVDPLAELRRVPMERVRAMQRVIAHRAHTLQYALPSAKGAGAPKLAGGGGGGGSSWQHAQQHDAFAVAVKRLSERAASAAEVSKGIATQQTAGVSATRALASLDAEPHIGYCMRTGALGSTCRDPLMYAGGWSVELGGDGFGGEKGVHSLDDCAARCQSACPNCHYVSLSHAHHTCTWFASCDLSMLRTDFGGGTYRTRQVRPGNAFPDPPPGLQCDVSLRKQISSMPCKGGANYGCYDVGAGEAGRMWAVRGCRGLFRLDGAELGCGSQLDGRLRNCSTAAAGARASHRRRNGTAH